MKMVLVAVALTASSLAHAGSPPSTTCTNSGGTITYNMRTVSVLTTMHPQPKHEVMPMGDLEVIETVVQVMPSEKYGCTSREIAFKKISFRKLDGKTPDAYNLLGKEGVLTDYFVCTRSYAWMPQPGQSCK